MIPNRKTKRNWNRFPTRDTLWRTKKKKKKKKKKKERRLGILQERNEWEKYCLGLQDLEERIRYLQVVVMKKTKKRVLRRKGLGIAL
jgi:hypothetical protein